VRSDFGEFFQWREVIAEQVCPPEQVIAQFTDESAFRVGTGWNAYLQFSEKRFTGTDIELPNALYMLELARVNWLQKEVISALDIEPIYLRNEVTWKKLPGRE
ncbi:tRNA threonylcarbamoyladenosine biosynthesis protein TsaB, partial [Rodentibacter pneumotropicus]